MRGSRDLSRVLCDRLLRAAAPLVPGDVRDDWLREWRAEVAWRLGREGRQRARAAAVTRCLGAWWHAAWLRWDRWRVEMLWQDLKYAVRMLVRRPTFTAIAVVTLALGIGANAAIFSVVHAVLIRPLPYAEPAALVQVSSDRRQRADNLSPADFLDFESESTTLTRMGAHGWVGAATVGGDGADAERVGAVLVTEGFFPTLGVQPALGRTFTLAEDQPGAERVALLADGFWRRRFGADPGVVGRVISVDARPVTVIGVLPAAYRHFEERTDRTADVFMLHRFDPTADTRGSHFIRGVGRLASTATLATAQAELGAVAARLEAEFPDTNAGKGVRLQPLHEYVVGASRPALRLLLGAVGLVLLIVCANLANLLLAAGAARQRELAVRAALGAGRHRIVRQLVTEAVVIGAAGALVGLILAAWVSRWLAVFAAGAVPRAGDVAINGTVVAFAAAAALVTSVLFGVVPALTLSGKDVHASLKAGGRQLGDVARHATRRTLITAEVALSVMLLVGATLLLQSLWRLQGVETGFRAAGALAADVSLPLARYPEGTQIPFYERLETAVQALPGVAEVGAVNILPLTTNYDSRGIQIEEAPQPVGQNPSVQARSVTPGYFRAMGMTLVRGRLFDARDAGDAPLVVVISESMARQYWPGRDPLGRRITFNSGIDDEGRREVGGSGSREVIGIVADIRHLALAEDEPVPMFYSPNTQPPSYHWMTLVVRSAVDATALTPGIRRALSGLDREVPLSNVRTLDQVVAGAAAAPRVRAVLLSVFAGLALLLAAVGVYGVVAGLVGQRTQEIGVRLALGASPGSVMALLVGEGMRPVAVGLVAGVAGAFALSRLMQTLLFDVAPMEVSAYLASAGALVLAALVATIVPARRALGVSPVIALRGE
jgi:putative ABC transport system permease protein